MGAKKGDVTVRVCMQSAVLTQAPGDQKALLGEAAGKLHSTWSVEHAQNESTQRGTLYTVSGMEEMQASA